MTSQEKEKQHKEHLCINYKPIIGQNITMDGKRLKNPETNNFINACIRSTKHGGNHNRCDLCDNFKEK